MWFLISKTGHFLQWQCNKIHNLIHNLIHSLFDPPYMAVLLPLQWACQGMWITYFIYIYQQRALSPIMHNIIIHILVNAKHCGASLRKRHSFQSAHARTYVTAAGRPVCHLYIGSAAIASPTVSYIIAASGPVSHLQFYWPLCFCRKYASSWV